VSALARMLRLPQYARNVQRLRFILGVVVRHGFGHVLQRAGLARLLPFTGGGLALRADESLRKESWEVRVRMALESLGPTFVKLGQMMATRPDIIPMSLIHELRKLQDDVPGVKFPAVRRLIQDELGVPLGEAYAWFDETPLAAASIAQVHRARLHDGSEVVVKVQRPNLDQRIRTDLDLLMIIAEQLEERVAEARQFRPVALVEQFSRSIKKETDFDNERANIERFRKQFEAEPNLHLPRTWPELSTRRALTMEFIDGCKVTDQAQMEAWGVDCKEVAQLGTKLVMAAVFEHGFFHADPHPGNFFVLPDGRLALIDFGMMGSLDRERVDEMLAFLAAILLADPEMLVAQLMDLGLIGDSVDVRALRTEIHELLSRYYGMEIGALDIGIFITEVFETIIRYDVRMPSDLLLVGKSVSTMEGIARQIQPDFNPMLELRPYLVRLYARRALDPSAYSRRVWRVAHDWWGLARSLPNDVRGLARRVRDGEIVLNINDTGQGERQVRTERQINRVIVAAASFLSWGLFSVLVPEAAKAGFFSFTTFWAFILAVNGTWTSALLAFSLLRSREL